MRKKIIPKIVIKSLHWLFKRTDNFEIIGLVAKLIVYKVSHKSWLSGTEVLQPSRVVLSFMHLSILFLDKRINILLVNSCFSQRNDREPNEKKNTIYGHIIFALLRLEMFNMQERSPFKFSSVPCLPWWRPLFCTINKISHLPYCQYIARFMRISITDRSRAVVLVLFWLCVILWFLLRGFCVEYCLFPCSHVCVCVCVCVYVYFSPIWASSWDYGTFRPP